MPIDIRLDPDTHDLDPVGRFVTDTTLQRIKIRLGTFSGEWILDTSVGLPFIEWLQRKPVPVDEIGDRIRREIETTPGVLKVLDFEGEFDDDEQTLSYTARVLVEGQTEPVAVVVGLDRSGNTNPLITFRGIGGTW